jgi:hypothetical protein
MYKIPFNLRFKIDAKVFSFTLNFINKSCRIWNLVSNKISFAILGFFCGFLRILQGNIITWNNRITRGGVSVFLRSGPWKRPSSHRCAPVRPRPQLAARSRRVLAGLEIAGGEEPVGLGPRDLGDTVEVNVHDGWQWNRINDGKVRRPWRRVTIPGEGPANRRS